MGPAPKESAPPPAELSLENYRDYPDTPGLRPDYSQPLYDTQERDAAKRNLFQEESGGHRPRRPSSEVWHKVTKLGIPYEVHEEDRLAAAKSNTSRYLSAKTSAPFFAAAMVDANMELSFPPEEEEDQELGMASRTTPKTTPRPYIPVLKSLQTNVRQLQSSLNVPRHKWHADNFPAPPEVEKEFFQPAEVPKSCWQQMRDDAFSWCHPQKDPPAGVEGADSSKPGPSKPHKVSPWNESRDTELFKLEALSRDGLRLANASMVAFAHLLNGSLDPSKQMSEKARKHAFYTVNDLIHVQASQFARISHKIALLRKLNVARSLNISDQGSLMNTKISSDLFDGKWPEIQAKELEARKQRADKEKQRRAKQAGSKSQSFRQPRDQGDKTSHSKSQQPHQQQSFQKAPQRKQDGQKNKGRNDKKTGGPRKGAGGSRRR